MSDASDSNAIPPGLEGPVPRDDSNDMSCVLKTIQLRLSRMEILTLAYFMLWNTSYWLFSS